MALFDAAPPPTPRSGSEPAIPGRDEHRILLIDEASTVADDGCVR